ncbi:MAG: hypothetical protein ABJA80_09670 [bacterium]
MLLPSSAHAQRAADLLTAGVKVRVTAPVLERGTGTVVSYGSDMLTVAPEAGAAPLRVATSTITKLEVSRGKNRLKWGLGGALAGGLAVAIIGGVQGGHDDPTGLGAGTGVAAGFILGALLGGIGGAVFAPERWQDVTAVVTSAP